ncbi:hypothetical protein A946_01950 [Methylacidiphilum kamchatkense Kam1]|uniref:Uncharacterized protein n=1 Tax=Methylacidiphilum kamchatkense Kam1 TaxID=1202785 RepID=A0ABR5A0D4_9BACT|nr:hypothetical protein A946_01950 [Methylacidiphilum kamchatkense Kam1]
MGWLPTRKDSMVVSFTKRNTRLLLSLPSYLALLQASHYAIKHGPFLKRTAANKVGNSSADLLI